VAKRHAAVGSRNTYAFDPESRLADDGDPVDVLVLMDEPAFASCLPQCRLIGVIDDEQTDGKKKTRNDRLVAVEEDNHSYAAIRHIDDLGKAFVRELEEFFVNYHELTGKRFQILDVSGPKEARRRVEAGRRKARKQA